MLFQKFICRDFPIIFFLTSLITFARIELSPPFCFLPDQHYLQDHYSNLFDAYFQWPFIYFLSVVVLHYFFSKKLVQNVLTHFFLQKLYRLTEYNRRILFILLFATKKNMLLGTSIYSPILFLVRFISLFFLNPRPTVGAFNQPNAVSQVFVPY